MIIEGGQHATTRQEDRDVMDVQHSSEEDWVHVDKLDQVIQAEDDGSKVGSNPKMQESDLSNEENEHDKEVLS